MTESTDRELIELAAKAADLGFVPSCDGGMGMIGGVLHKPWNPLESDADAFRLAVKLGIDVHTGDTFGDGGVGFTTADCFRGGRIISMQMPHDGDPYAATRRAITRAAAEIGKAMGEA